MKLSKLYSDNEKFKPIKFNSGLNIIFWNINQNKKWHENGLWKSTLIELIDFMLIKKKSASNFCKKLADVIDWNFFLEIELPDHKYLTIKRNVCDTKVCIATHTTWNKNLIKKNNREYSNIWEDSAIDIINKYLSFDVLPTYTYRKFINYVLRTQNDYNNIFKMNQSSKDRDWKPYLFWLLWFNENILIRKYSLDDLISNISNHIEYIKTSLSNWDEWEKRWLKLSLEEKKKELEKELDSTPFSTYTIDETDIEQLVNDIEKNINIINNIQYQLTRELHLINESLDSKENTYNKEKVKEFLFELNNFFKQNQTIVNWIDQVFLFQRKLTKERNKYLRKRRKEILTKLDELKIAHQKLDAEKEKNLKKIKEQNMFYTYSRKAHTIIDISEKINSLDKELIEYKKIQDRTEEITKLKEEQNKINDSLIREAQTNPDYFKKIKKNIEYIYTETYDKKQTTNLSISINKLHNPEFKSGTYDDENFNETQQGNWHSANKILCTWLVLGILAAYHNKKFFKFAYHDWILESWWNTPKTNFFKIAKEFCNNYWIQYIISVIKTDLPNQDIITNEDIAISLDKNNKLLWLDF